MSVNLQNGSPLADLAERRSWPLTILDAVYVDAKEERRIVALKPKPAFKVFFQIATTKEGSGVILYNEKTLAQRESFDDLCSWWRRGGSICTEKHTCEDIYHQQN